jgi:L-ascorbate metabolism protein UlaG (beta-lactamase superfamily)
MLKKIFKILGIFLVLFCLYFVREANKTYYQGPVTANFNGKFFHNYNHEGIFDLRDMLAWQYYEWKGEIIKAWPKELVEDFTPSYSVEPEVGGSRVKITFINHASFLIQTENLNILTDPVYSERVSPVTWAGPKRYRAPGIDIEALPTIDYILVSHDHYDHCDLSTLKQIQDRHGSIIYSGLGMKHFLADFAIKARELDWWENTSLTDELNLNFVPAVHWSGRYGIIGNNRTLWGGFVLSHAEKGNFYFAGDTAFGDVFSRIQKKFKQFKAAMIPIGAYEPRWFMKHHHVNPEEAVKIHQIIKSKKSIAAHFGSFGLSQEGEGSPEKELRKYKTKFNLSSDEFLDLKHGESIEF